MIYEFLADGFEEIEAIVPLDVLRRLSFDVISVSVSDKKEVAGAHGITVTADKTISQTDLDAADMYILPGGMPGTENLLKCGELCRALERANGRGAYIGAICAAPSVLGKLGILKGRKATCFPGFESALSGAEVTGAAFQISGNIVTARGAGCAHDFAFALSSLLTDEKRVSGLKKSMQYE